jgi:hypothetical protein
MLMDIQPTFDRFAEDLLVILGDNLYDIIIHGSYALGDFRPNQGDLDYIAVTHSDLDELTNERLFALHDGYRSKRELFHQAENRRYPYGHGEVSETMVAGCTLMLEHVT